jgi:pantoate--beta-alanine ligase
MLEILYSQADVHQHLAPLRAQGSSIGFVPTMGALHIGHQSLVEASKHENAVTVVSIFVNPRQFGPNEDLSRYPRTPQTDYDLLHELEVPYLFLPSESEMYPADFAIDYQVGDKGKHWCGKSRPGHFQGVAEAVARLFTLIQPDKAYFGQKDFQQTVIVQDLIHTLSLPVKCVVCPTIREPDGLAFSSRNRYLNAKDRTAAAFIYHSLLWAKELAERETPVESIVQIITQAFENYPAFRLDYFGIANRNNLTPLTGNVTPETPAIALIAAYLGNTRLIDNLPLNA